MCEKNGPQLGAGDDLFHRQVPPSWIDDGEPSTQAFWPWRNLDECCLSVDRGSRVTAAEAFQRFTNPKPLGFGMPSQGVWSLSRQELEGESLTTWQDELRATQDTPANSAHALIDFTAHDEKAQKKVGRRLKAMAIKRGRAHP